MLFTWEEYTHQYLMIFILIVSAIAAIAINQSDLSGKKKLTFFKLVYRFCLFFLIPASIYIIVVQFIALYTTEFISMEKHGWRFYLAFGAFFILLISVFRIRTLSAEGIHEANRKSITASKFLRIFQKLRASFMALIVVILVTYLLTYTFSM